MIRAESAENLDPGYCEDCGFPISVDCHQGDFVLVGCGISDCGWWITLTPPTIPVNEVPKPISEEDLKDLMEDFLNP